MTHLTENNHKNNEFFTGSHRAFFTYTVQNATRTELNFPS